MMPRFTIERARQQLETSFPTATAAVKTLEDLGIISYHAYVEILSRS